MKHHVLKYVHDLEMQKKKKMLSFHSEWLNGYNFSCNLYTTLFANVFYKLFKNQNVSKLD